MAIRKDHDEIWYWHQKIEEFHESGMKPINYCDSYEIDYKLFCNMKYRIEYKRFSDAAVYKRNVPITRKYMNSGTLAAKFAKENCIDIRLLHEMATHLRYRDIIEDMKEARAAKEEKTMSFIQVPQRMAIQDAEIVEKQNDIEIIITKGVKVSISPNIDSMKIIKIIELLKDL